MEGRMKPVSVTTNELLDALRAAAPTPIGAPTGAYSMTELAAATGWGRRQLGQQLASLKAAGRLESTNVQREAIDGLMRQLPVYRILPAPRKKAA
jgi:hypothetical protein